MLDPEDEEEEEPIESEEEEEEERDKKPKVKTKPKVKKKESEEEDEEPEEELQEIENPYTVTNRAISELVSPKDTMFYLSDIQVRLILSAYEFAKLPQYFGEEPVEELAEYATKLKHYLVSKGGRGRRDILRVLRVSSGTTRENVNKSLFKQLLNAGKEEESED